MSFKAWREYKFTEIMKIIGGGTPKTEIGEYWNGDISWLSVKDFNSVNRFVYDSEKKITKLGLEKSSTNMLKKGELVISARGTVGALAQLGKPMAFNQSCYGLRANEKTTNDFLFYLLKYKIESIRQNTHGSVFDTITRNTFNTLTASIPDNINEQKAIAHILSTLDEKIEVNNQINKTLEEMAQEIFKHWFVEFEFPCLPEDYHPQGHVNRSELEKVCTYKRVSGLPVPDGKSWFVYVLLCDNGSFYKGMTKDLYRRFYEHYSGYGAEWTKKHKPIKVIHYEEFNNQQDARNREEELKTGFGREWIKREYKKSLSDSKMVNGLPAHQTRLMMAGEMVESELGMIPKEWEVNEFEEVFFFQEGPEIRNWQYVESDGTKFINIRCIQNNDLKLDTANMISNEEATGKYAHFILDEWDVIISSSGTLGRYAIIRKEHLPLCLNTSVIRFKPKISFDHFSFMFGYLTSNEFYEHLITKASGSVQANFGPMHLRQIKLVYPQKEIIRRYHKLVFSIIKSSIQTKKENDLLVKLRDTLLPKLMSGEIRIPLNMEDDIS